MFSSSNKRFTQTIGEEAPGGATSSLCLRLAGGAWLLVHDKVRPESGEPSLPCATSAPGLLLVPLRLCTELWDGGSQEGKGVCPAAVGSGALAVAPAAMAAPAPTHRATCSMKKTEGAGAAPAAGTSGPLESLQDSTILEVRGPKGRKTMSGGVKRERGKMCQSRQESEPSQSRLPPQNR